MAATRKTHRHQTHLDVGISDEVLRSMSEAERGKLYASYYAVNTHVKSGQIVGVGSGSTIVYAVQRISERVKEEGLQIICIPTSFQARELILRAGLPLSDLTIHPEIDVTIDGADEVCESNLDCIKGGGGCHVQEKIVAFNSKVFVVVADESKLSPTLGTHWTKGVPIEVVPLAHVAVLRKLAMLGGKGGLRMAQAKMGPLVTDNGNFILDVHFGALSGAFSPVALEQKIRMIPGVVDCGLFVGIAQAAYFGRASGDVVVLEFD